jgi:hypothetical protein
MICNSLLINHSVITTVQVDLIPVALNKPQLKAAAAQLVPRLL